MARVGLVCAVIGMAMCAAGPLTVGEEQPIAKEEEFTSLFDGKTLQGWVVSNKTGHGKGGSWEVKDGAIFGVQDTPGSGGILVTDKQFGDFELRLEANPTWPIDSGIFLRSTMSGRCYQVLLDYRPGGNVAGLYGEGLNPGFHVQAKDWKKHWKENDWNKFRIIIRNSPPTISTWLNGEPMIQDWTDPAKDRKHPAKGHIGLQIHGGNAWVNKPVRFRNVRIRELETK